MNVRFSILGCLKINVHLTIKVQIKWFTNGLQEIHEGLTGFINGSRGVAGVYKDLQDFVAKVYGYYSFAI